MNNYTVEIFKDGVWVNKTSKAVFPLKYSNLLDERLDEAEIDLKRLPEAFFNPLIKVRLTVTNSPECRVSQAYYNKIVARKENPFVEMSYNSTTKRVTETMTINMLVASDNSVRVMYDGKYNHKMYLIELTKLLERFIGDSITFTNSLGNVYTD